MQCFTHEPSRGVELSKREAGGVCCPGLRTYLNTRRSDPGTPATRRDFVPHPQPDSHTYLPRTGGWCTCYRMHTIR
jgi:hypothetical protein